MKIGILGSGDVGRKLADGFIQTRHVVKIGSRNPNQEKITEWMAKHDKAKISSGTFAEAASFGELDVIATLWAGTADAIKMADPENFAGKIVIDVTNPLDFSKGMPPRLAVGHTDSDGETVQRMLPRSKGVKAFNTAGSVSHFIHPDFPGGPPIMLICGNDDEVKKSVTDNILTKFGWETIDIGGIDGARLLEPLALLWITHYFRIGNGNHVFKLLQK